MRNLTGREWGYTAVGTSLVGLGLWLALDQSSGERIAAAPEAAYEKLVDEPAQLPATTLEPVVTEPAPVETNNRIAAGSAEMPCAAGEIIYGVETTEPFINVTIDDGPSETTRAKLQVFREHPGNYGTFYFLAERLNTPDGQAIAAEVLADGHEIGTHSNRHVLGNDGAEINAAEQPFTNTIFQDKLGFLPYSTRMVGLNYSSQAMRESVVGAGQCIIDVSIAADTKDWECDFQTDDAVVQNYMVGRVAALGFRTGDFILMHDGSVEAAENGGQALPRPNGAFELDLILDRAESMGMHSETVAYALAHGTHINQSVPDESRHEC